MLVYANHLRFRGEGARDAIFRAVGAWLKEQMGYGLHPEQVRSGGEHKGRRGISPAWLYSFVTNEEDPELYSWVLRVADNSVQGRQWITELGLKIFDNEYDVSCVLRTDEHSALVTAPIVPSRPRVIRYIVDNVAKEPTAGLRSGAIGAQVKRVGVDEDSYRGLLMDIERTSRNYPVILVSPDYDGQYLINTNHIQDELVGLAQVVELDVNYDSYGMAEVLGREWSAWSGAVNMISTASRTGHIRNRLFRSEEIVGWGETQHERITRILAWVTSNTNIPRSRDRINPEGVKQLALRRRLQRYRSNTESMDVESLHRELDDVWRTAEEQSEDIDQLKNELQQAGDEILELEGIKEDLLDAIRKKDYAFRELKGRLSNSGEDVSSAPVVNMLLEILVRPGQPSAVECLEIIRSVHADTFIVLDPALRSANEVNQFIHGRKLLNLLVKLVTEYRSGLMRGGDNVARKVFGRNEYAATESERVTANPTMRRLREVEYEGKTVEMLRHLKIGVEDDETKTLRVHFHWDARREKIVIGHCGRHLAISSH